MTIQEQVFNPLKFINEGSDLQTVTVIYYDIHSLELQDDVKAFSKNANGRVVLLDEYRKGKSIIAICEGNVNILNKVGERILPGESDDVREMEASNTEENKVVTVIYYCDYSLDLKHDVQISTKLASGRVSLTDEYRLGKSILAVCEGDIKIINKAGERIAPMLMAV